MTHIIALDVITYIYISLHYPTDAGESFFFHYSELLVVLDLFSSVS